MNLSSMLEHLEDKDSSELTRHMEVNIDVIKQQIQFYNDEVALMNEIFNDLNFNFKDLEKYAKTKFDISKFSNQMKEFSINNVILAQSENLKKSTSYLPHIKNYIKLYNNLNAALISYIEFAKKELKRAHEKISSINCLSINELEELQAKIKQYERNIRNFEKQYPFLKNPDFDLINIKNNIDKLQALYLEKNSLEQELSKYQGLKPDLNEATSQLNNIKCEFKDITNKLNQNV